MLRSNRTGRLQAYGAVADAQGGLIAGARVTLTHIERNQAREAGTNSEGQFVFPLIPIGSYRLRVEHPGFKAFEQSGVTLRVNDNRKIDITLEVGDISASVHVEAAAAAVETSSATLKSVVDGKRVLELPLNGRNVLQLGLLVPGVQNAGGGTISRMSICPTLSRTQWRNSRCKPPTPAPRSARVPRAP